MMLLHPALLPLFSAGLHGVVELTGGATFRPLPIGCSTPIWVERATTHEAPAILKDTYVEFWIKLRTKFACEPNTPEATPKSPVVKLPRVLCRSLSRLSRM